MTQHWYTKLPGDDAEAGPQATEAIFSKLARGELGPGTLVRRDGDGTWIALGEHLKFRAACPSVELSGARAAQVSKPVPTQASTSLWMVTALSFVSLLVLQFRAAPASTGPDSAPELDLAYDVGSFTGTFLLLLAIAWFPSLWSAKRTQRHRVRLFFIATLVLLTLNVSSRLAIQGTRAYVKAGQDSQSPP
jgi:hypothetical protein